MVECLLSMQKALGSIPSIAHNEVWLVYTYNLNTLEAEEEDQEFKIITGHVVNWKQAYNT